MKNTWMTFALMLTILAARGQDGHANLVSLAGGISLPAGTFRSTQSRSGSGYAKNGFALEAAFQHRLRKRSHFGYTANIRFQHYQFNKSAAGALDGTAWRQWSATVGPIWYFSLSKKFAVEPYAMVGIGLNTSPKQSYASEGIVTEPEHRVKSFNAQAGFNFRFDPGSRISIQLRFSYQLAMPRFAYTNFIYGGTTTVTQHMNSINGLLSVGYRFR